MNSLQPYLDLLQEKKAFAHLATVMPDGSPQVSPVWVDYRHGKLLVNTAKGRVKARNMAPGAKVSLSIADPDNPYRYVQIRGTVAGVSAEGADEHVNFLSKKYLGQDVYPFRQPGEERLICEIEPAAVQGMG